MAQPDLMLRYAARSHVGLVRAKNDDSAYAGRYLAVVADGMGGHAGGDVASASTVLDLVHLDRGDYSGDAGTHLADEIQNANSLLSELVHVNPKLAGMGTTVTSLLLDGSTLAFAHIGDSRAYRLKDGVFEQMSTDHTFVQRMIDEGRMSEADAEVHPHKNVLMRVLGDVDASPELDLTYFDTAVGERWLLCSDGLNFVRHSMVEEVVRNSKDLKSAADTLIDLTLAAGSPDNVTVVVFDVVDWAEEPAPANDASTTELPRLLSEATAAQNTSASAPNVSANGGPAPDPANLTDDDGSSPFTSDATKSVAETEPDPETETETEPGSETDTDSAARSDEEEVAAPELDEHIRAAVILEELSRRPHELVGAAVTANAEGKIPQLAHHRTTRRAATVLTHKTEAVGSVPVGEVSTHPPRLRRILVWSLATAAVLALVAGSWIAYAWTQSQYFVGVTNGNVAIYKGVSQNLGPITLSHLERETKVSVSSLPEYSQQLVNATMPASSLSAAEQIISDLQLGAGVSTPPCELPASPFASPSATPTVNATASPQTAASASTTSKETASSTETTTKVAATTSASAASQGLASPTCIPGGPQ